jgi:tetratricopeptide (TPR) repeat protein
MRKAAVILTALLISVSSAPAQKITPKTESERLGAESYNKAVKAFSAGEFAASIPWFLAADSLIGEKGIIPRSKLRFALATAYLSNRQPAQALEWYSKVAAEDPSYPEVQYQTAESARLAGQADQALKYYGLALPQAEETQKLLILQRTGELLEKKNDLKGALDAYNKALAIRSEPKYRLLRGQIYDRLAQTVDHAQDENFDVDAAVKNGALTESKMQQALELREKALADYQAAAADPALSANAGRLIERSEAILKNDRLVLGEIINQKTKQ